ncbi:hypothetical protein [Geodermatophilus amargosae]|uniref:hypothetical protein n=1 Tax=Geodermatophilus amargosae TaxID=1296565 RepID=UPI000B818A9C|nr:hypothetical protein [Geodermatophilus amargosae]
MPRSREPRPELFLRFHTAAETAAAEALLALMSQALEVVQREEDGAAARLSQLLTLLVNPHQPTVTFVDHEERIRCVPTTSSRVAQVRLSALGRLREVGLNYEAIGSLLGLSKSAVQAIFDRAAGRRLRQVRISATDAALLEAVKACADGWLACRRVGVPGTGPEEG